jgi:ribosomal protein S18 acetylase RimI-like enzyme
MTNDETILLIRLTDSLELSHELQTIYEEAFPPDERREWAQFTELLNNPDFFLKAISIQKKLIGLLTYWNLEEFLFIEHFAIRDAERGKGLGTQVVNQLIAETASPLILEVEEPITETAQNRIHFYERFSFSVCKSEYFQPPYSADKNKVKMLLMSYPDEVSDEYFTIIKDRIYRLVYGIYE